MNKSKIWHLSRGALSLFFFSAGGGGGGGLELKRLRTNAYNVSFKLCAVQVNLLNMNEGFLPAPPPPPQVGTEENRIVNLMDLSGDRTNHDSGKAGCS